MAIQIAIRATTLGTIAVMRRLGAFVEARRLRRLGERLTLRWVNRTRQGKSRTGARFKPYTAAYAAQKGVGRRSVDLKDTGAMQRALKVQKATSRSIQVGVTGRQGRKAAGHQQGTGRLPKREWLGMSREDRRWLRTELKEIVRGQIDQAKRRGRRR